MTNQFGIEKDVKENLAVVIDYLEADEKRNYEESDFPSNHIYLHVLRLKFLLSE